MDIVYCILTLIISAGLAFIPTSIAKRKGYSFVLWWLYGWIFWIVALIHISLIPDKNVRQTLVDNTSNYLPLNSEQVANELKKYKALFDQGILTEYEFQAKKEELLKLI
jgi:hypothetical protein